VGYCASYVLPIRRTTVVEREIAELAAYFAGLSVADIIVVDGSPPEVFERHHAAWQGLVRHVPVDADLHVANGKAAGVLTGMRLVRNEIVIVADDDVRYDVVSVAEALDAMTDADICRPQNVFDPRPWHARHDTARSLVNRALDGDWPGTLIVRRSAYERTGGYDGNVLFENLELVRTIRAAGGREHVARSLFVRRLPPDTGRFFEQRVRQAYDEFARPARLLCELAIGPAVIALALRRRYAGIGALVLAVIGIAEYGRRRDDGALHFGPTSALLAPGWALERGITSWLALATRIALGGMRYGNVILDRAATPLRVLRARLNAIPGGDVKPVSPPYTARAPAPVLHASAARARAGSTSRR